jgi:nucleotide-binding universal stress UspA family protein
MGRIRRVLHPTDFSRASAAAFNRAVETAKANRAELLLVNVITPSFPPIGDGYISPKVYAEMEASARAYARKQLDAQIAKAKRAGVRVRGLILEGSLPHERIVQVARRKRADLLVMGTHGRTGLAKFFLGSVASRVLAIAPCPVLTVRGT